MALHQLVEDLRRHDPRLTLQKRYLHCQLQGDNRCDGNVFFKTCPAARCLASETTDALVTRYIALSSFKSIAVATANHGNMAWKMQ